MKIRARLRLVSMLVSGTAIIFACGTFILVSVHARHSGAVEDLQGLARVTVRNSEAAVDFGIQEDAEETLTALQVRPSIVLARIHDTTGQLFAEYRSPRYRGSPPASIPDRAAVTSGRAYLRVYEPIMTDQRFLGMLLIEDDRTSLRKDILRDLLIFGGVMVGALVIALLLANRLERRISGPVLALTEAAHAVSEQQDYALRVPALHDDEFALLANAFNHMLATIHARDAELQVEIAERRHAEQALREHRDKLEDLVAQRTAELKRSNMELEEFAYVASHDLQEPLRKVRSFTELFATKFGDQIDEDGRRYINYVVDGAERMQGLIQDLLTYSRVGRAELEQIDGDIGSIVDDVLVQIEQTVKDAGAIVTRDHLPTLPVNPRQIGMLIQNLLTNAIKFRGPEPPCIHISADEHDGEWRFAVKDNGIGIKPEHFTRVFQIFQRLHGRSQYPGTGIGLAICKRVIERHGGRIWIESTAGEGSTFTFTLPKRPTQTQTGVGS